MSFATLDVSAGTIGLAVGTVLLAALGAFVLTARPRTRATALVGAYCVAFGVSFGSFAAVPFDHPWYPVRLVGYTLADLVTAVCLALLAFWIPRPLAPRRLVVPALVVGGWAAFTAAVIAFEAGTLRDGYLASGLAPAYVTWTIVDENFLFNGILRGTALGAFVLFALRYAEPTASAVERRQSALVAATAAMLAAPFAVPDSFGSAGFVWNAVAAASLAAAAAAWLWASARVPGATAARNVALLAVGLPVVLYLDRRFWFEVAAGASSIAAALLLAYAVLRTQLLGLDVKVRWTISKSTIAAAFVAVFFVASEGAQMLFGEGNELVGLVAAGALVFAIAPLQRAADRLAERAVPIGGQGQAQGQGDGHGQGQGSAATREAVYRAAARRYLRDGVLTRDEQRELAHLAGELGLHAGRAMEIVQEVEAEVAA